MSKATTPADALADLEKQIVAAQDAAADARRRWIASGSDRDRKNFHAARRTCADLEAECDAWRAELEADQPTVHAEREEAERQHRIVDARRQLDELLVKRAAAAEAVSDALDQLAAALAAFDLTQQDIAGTVHSLRALAGRDTAPDTYPFRTDAAVLDAVYRSGLGRTGLRMSGRVTVEPPVFLTSGKVTPLIDAIKLDHTQLAEQVDRMLEPVGPPAPVTTIEDWEAERRAARAAHQQRERDAIDAEAREQDAKRRERTERRQKLANTHQPKVASGAL